MLFPFRPCAMSVLRLSLFCLVLPPILPAFSATPSVAGGDTPFETVRVTLKFLRLPGGQAQEPVRLLPESCGDCVQDQDPTFARENAHETIVSLKVPLGRSLEPVFEATPGVFGAVVLQTGKIPVLERISRHIRIALPPVREESTEASEFATHLTGPGYVLRFEHADPVRRFGAYAQALPTTQRLAANNIEFALREAVLELGLGERVVAEGVGTIEIMGFDTNDPHGHTDAPPHVHMHLRWPYNSGTQIGHFYLAPDGRFDHDSVGISGLGVPTRLFGKEQRFDTISPRHTVFFSQTITADGGLLLGVPDGRSCLIGLPDEDFARQVSVRCTGRQTLPIRVQDDLERGMLSVGTGPLREVFRYDPGTGVLLSPTAAPPFEASAMLPTFSLGDPIGAP